MNVAWKAPPVFLPIRLISGHPQPIYRFMKSEKEIQKMIEGHKPVTQFTTAKLRAMSREGYEMSMTHIVAIAKGDIDEAPYAARISAHNSLGKNGMGDSNLVWMENREWLSTVYTVTAKFLKDYDRFHEWLAEVHAALRYPQ